MKFVWNWFVEIIIALAFVGIFTMLFFAGRSGV